ncbi:MAG TPA: M20/M25/M40 family metallo-hydrolase [Vicinamibacterales bacterium]|nr:M20/M25/M40 family metallo-hydrolase [Vicinamibacterales bacterium]
MHTPTRLATAALVAVCAGAALTAAPSAAVLNVRAWRETRERQIVGELMRLVALPNIASNRADIARNADLLTTMFEARNFNVMRVETPGSPVLIARRDIANARGTLLFYFHYDGQPSDPKAWTRGGPFAPVVMSGPNLFPLETTSTTLNPELRVYGRSTSDDKGPIVALLAAVDGLAATKASPAWNLRIVLDGEEEAGSPNFGAAMKQHAADVRADIAVVVDSPRHPSGLPTVFYGSRGTSGAVITVYGAVTDLHSGNYGNFTTDPTMALAKLLASMKDDNGNVRIKNFTDGVVPLTPAEHRAIGELPNVDAKLLEQFGLMQAEHPDSRIELQHNHPTLSITGIESGAVSAGARSAIPGSASARVEMRLVKGLDAQTQFDRLVAHIREQGFHVTDTEPDRQTRRAHRRIARVTRTGGGFPVAKASLEDPRTAPVVSAIRSLDQRLAQMPTIGGSLPFATFSETLALPTIGLAIVNFDNNQHGPDENLRLGNLWDGIDIFAALLTMSR